MQTINVLVNQSLVDLALQLYGNIDAINELINLNPQLYPNGTELDIAQPIAPGTIIIYDETSPLRQNNALKEITEPIVTADFY